MFPVRVAILDVGSNTVRLLVADQTQAGLRTVLQERAYVGLGDEIEALRAVVAADYEKYARVIREAGIRAD